MYMMVENQITIQWPCVLRVTIIHRIYLAPFGGLERHLELVGREKRSVERVPPVDGESGAGDLDPCVDALTLRV